MVFLIIDTETTGLPDTSGLPFGKYHHYTKLEKYSTSRIVQISYTLCNSQFDEISSHDFIIKRDNFSIDNHQFHGITNQISDTEGVEFKYSAEDLFQKLKSTEYIFAHNAAFDINIIKSELCRYGLNEVLGLLNMKKIVCTMYLTKPIVKAIGRSGLQKNPSLAELFRYCHGSDMDNAHNSRYDVLNLLYCLKFLHNNNKISIN